MFNNCSLCDRLNVIKKVCLHSLAVRAYHMKSVAELGFSMNSHSTTRHLKHSSNFESVENVLSSNVVEFEFHHIPSFDLELESLLRRKL